MDSNNNEAVIQGRFIKSNHIYKITSDIDLQGGTLTIPSGCTLDFQGGSFSNGNIIGKTTKIIAGQRNIFNDCKVTGTLQFDIFYPEWFGYELDSDECFTRISSYINQLPHTSNSIFDRNEQYVFKFPENTYSITIPFVLNGGENITIQNLNLKAKGQLLSDKEDDNSYMLVIKNSTYISLKSLRVNGNFLRNGIKLYAAYITDIDDCKIFRFIKYGIFANGESQQVNKSSINLQNSYINQCTWDDLHDNLNYFVQNYSNSVGLKMNFCPDSNITNTTINYVIGDIINNTNQSNVTIRGCHFYNYSLQGLIDLQSPYCFIYDTYFDGTKLQLNLYFGVYNNFFLTGKNTDYLINITQSDGSLYSQSIITGNVFKKIPGADATVTSTISAVANLAYYRPLVSNNTYISVPTFNYRITPTSNIPNNNLPIETIFTDASRTSYNQQQLYIETIYCSESGSYTYNKKLQKLISLQIAPYGKAIGESDLYITSRNTEGFTLAGSTSAYVTVIGLV